MEPFHIIFLVLASVLIGGALTFVGMSSWVEKQDKQIKEQNDRIQRLLGKITAQAELIDTMLEYIGNLEDKLNEKE